MSQFALVVENDEGTQKLLQVLLQRRGFDVDAVRGGREAVILARRIPYSIIVLDLMLPHLDGVGVLKVFRDEMPHLLRRTIVVSSASRNQLEPLVAEFSEVPLIRKPFEIDTLMTMAGLHAASEDERELDFDDTFCRASVRCQAKSGIIATMKDRTLYVAAQFGYSPEHIDTYFPLHVDAQFPICVAARGRQVWYASLSNAGAEYPRLLPMWNEQHSCALAALPIERDGAIIGAVGWSFAEPQLFRSNERESLTALAAMAADHLEPARQSNTA